jgi:flagellum-specific peptidoglycan hydrolase FlgJ
MTYKEEKTWFATHAPAAVAAMKTYGVPASITLAQGALESDWGKSKLALAPNNNFFGIKAKQGADYAEFKTTEFVGGKSERILAKFARYEGVDQSFDQHAKLLATLACYRPAMSVASDSLAFALRLQGVYATDPGYAKKLAKLINDYNLLQYDGQAKEAA